MMLSPDVAAIGQRRFTPAFTVSVAVHAAAALAIALTVQSQISRLDDSPRLLQPPVVWLPDMRPSAIGGGGRPKPAPAVADTPVATVPEPIPMVVEEPLGILPKSTAPVEALVAPGPPTVGADPTARGGAGRDGDGSGPGNGQGPGFGGTVYQGGNGVTWPVPIRRPPPKYTAPAMTARLQGIVGLKCIVGPDGRCSDIRVTRSLDPTLGLDQQAIESAKQWQFRPGTRLGEPVPVEINLEIEFNIR